MTTVAKGQLVSRLAQEVARRIEAGDKAVVVGGETYTLAAPLLRDLAVEHNVPLEDLRAVLVDAEAAGLVVTYHDHDTDAPLLVRALLL
jgi:hypothetical protein